MHKGEMNLEDFGELSSWASTERG